MSTYLWTGQANCYDINCIVISCENSGQDGEFRSGICWPDERFVVDGELVHDQLTGLIWLKNANLAEFPVTWQEALDSESRMNREYMEGDNDWRLPNRHELRSLMAFETRQPSPDCRASF